jgi:putative ABC transport system permease protein
MTLLRRLASVLRWLVRRKTSEKQLNDELQSFLAMSAAEKMRDGASPAEALRLANLELGGVDQVKEKVRNGRHGALLDEILGDLRHAIRMFAKSPGFILVIVLTLGLGIGANTAIFSLIDALMLRWLPVDNPEKLIQLELQTSDSKAIRDTFSYAIVREVAKQKEILASVAGFSSANSFNVGTPGATTKVSGAMVTGSFYEVLGIKPTIGRLLTAMDDEPGAAAAAVISYGYWERQFSRRPDALGKTLLINGASVPIVGVSAPGFIGANVGQIADITLPVAALPTVNPSQAGLLGPGNFWLRILARPNPALSVAESRTRFNAAWPGIAEEALSSRWPVAQRKALASAVFEFGRGGRGWTFLRQIYRKPLLVLMALVALVLLISCANVASLLLARGSVRQREIAVRLALGSGRGRILRQLLIESALLSLLGSIFGIGLAWVSSRFMVNMISAGPAQIIFDLTPNAHVLGFTSAIAIATAIAFGLAPALQISAAAPLSVLKEDSRSGSRFRLLPSLVGVQVAMSLILLIGASLFVRTLQNLRNLDRGFNSEGVLLVSFDSGQRSTIYEEVVEEAQRLPGAASASVSTTTPLSGFLWTEPAVPTGEPLPQNDNAIFVGTGLAFFRTMQTPLLSGREFTERDSTNSLAVAVIDETYAQQYFPNQNPLGKYISTTASIGEVPRGQSRNLEVVGVARNTSTNGLRSKPFPTIYVPYAQLNGSFPATLEVRANGSVASVIEGLRQALQPKFPNTPIEVRLLSAQVEAAMAQERMVATIAGGFAALALLVASVGLYGLLAYTVARRTREMGIRMVLGAQRRTVIALVMKSALGLLAIGVALALPIAWAASRWVESMLFGLHATDPGAIGAAVLLLTTAALSAAYLPARRASRIAPALAIREE